MDQFLSIIFFESRLGANARRRLPNLRDSERRGPGRKPDLRENLLLRVAPRLFRN
jgi:hypothetical protein